jgi:hypothetical protein
MWPFLLPKVALLASHGAADDFRSRVLLWQDGEDPWRDDNGGTSGTT